MNDTLSRLLVSLLVVIGFFVVVWGILYYPIKPDVKDIVLLLIGALIGEFKNATGFWFQTSATSVAKDATIAAIAQSPSPIPENTTVKVDTSAGPVPVTEVKGR